MDDRSFPAKDTVMFVAQAAAAPAWHETVTFLIALAGAGLGFYNTWNAHRQGKTRVSSSVGILRTPGSRPLFAVEVINRSTFPVVIAEIALSTPNGRGTRFAFMPPYVSGERIPMTLEARSSHTFWMAPVEEHREALAVSRWVLITTGDGQVFKDTSPLLKSLIKRAQDELSDAAGYQNAP